MNWNFTFGGSQNGSMTQMNNAKNISEYIGEDIPINSYSTAGGMGVWCKTPKWICII